MKWLHRKKVSEVEVATGLADRLEALACRPVKSLAVYEQKLENGEMLITYPLRLRPWFVNLARRLGLRSKESLTRRLQLDEMGTQTWTSIDGKRTVQDMVDLLSRRYSLNRRETEIAVTGFLRELGRRGLIGFLAPHFEENENST